MDVTQSGDMQQGSTDTQWGSTDDTQWSSADAQWSPSNTQYGSGDMQCDTDSTQSLAKDYLPLLFALLPILGYIFGFLVGGEIVFFLIFISLVGSGIYTFYATQKSKTFLAIYSLLFLACATGIPELLVAYECQDHCDYATPMVGFAMSFISGVIALLFIVPAWIVKIVGERKKRS